MTFLDAPSPPSAPVKVFVVEDQPKILKNQLKLLEGQARVAIVGTAMSGESALEELSRCQPEVVLMDLGLPGISGIEVTRRVKATFPGVRFEPPAPRTEVRDAEPTRVLAMPVRRTWMRFALAASVLFVLVFGGGALALVGYHRNQVEHANQEFARLQQEKKDLGDQYKDEEKSELDEMRQLQEKIKATATNIELLRQL